jgi:hypothetical protein
LRANGSRTIYFAGYKKIVDRYKIDEIEKAADVVVWCCDEAPGFTPGRVQDKAFVGNIVEAIAAYGRGDLDEPDIPLHAVDRLVVIGSDAMMGAVARARHTVLAPYLKPDHKAIGSINSPMQCMMKEICAMPAASQEPADRRGNGGVLLLQSGSAARSGGLEHPAHAPLAKRRSGKIDQAVDRPLPAPDGRSARSSAYAVTGCGARADCFA